MPKRVFISYGTADAIHVAEWLFRQLQANGYEVWWDRHRLPERAGSAWDAEIENAIRTSDAVIALLSPHSVRERGECRNEINFACDKGRRIVPVLARRCDRPLRINSLQYIDLENFESICEEVRATQFRRILAAIESGPEEDPAATALSNQFPRFDFDWMYSRHSRFVGRQWLLDRFDQWLRQENEPVLFLVGPPGIGKSAVLTEWVKTRMGVGGVHFCRHDREDLRNPEAMVASLAGQLLRHDIPGHRQALQAFLADPHSPKDAGSMLDRLVLDPLRRQPPGHRWVLAIDALDEGGHRIYELLARIKPYLAASRIRLLLTSRPDADILQLFENKLVLRASNEENLADVRQYIRGRLDQMPQVAALPANARAALEAQLVEQSEGTFLVAEVSADELECGRLSVDQIGDLSPGLAAMYAGLFGRRFPTRESFEPVRRPLEIMMSAFEPVADGLIAQALGLRPRAVAESLQCLSSIVPQTGAQGVRVPFHKSLFDWLESQEPGTRFSCSREDGEYAIATFMDAGGHESAYGMRWAVRHLSRAHRAASAQRLLRDLGWLDRRADCGFGIDLRDDLASSQEDSALAELAAIATQRLPMWMAGDSMPSVDSVNLSVPQSPLHRHALESAPRPVLEVLSDRPRVGAGVLDLPHPGIEYALPLEPPSTGRSEAPSMITFSRDQFMVWDGACRLVYGGQLSPALHFDSATDLEVLGTVPVGKGSEYAELVEHAPRLDEANQAIWRHALLNGRLSVVRFSRRHLAFAELEFSSGVVSVEPAPDVRRALAAVSLAGRIALRSEGNVFTQDELLQDEHSLLYVYGDESSEPLLVVDAAHSSVQGDRVCLRRRKRGIVSRPIAAGPLAIPIEQLFRQSFQHPCSEAEEEWRPFRAQREAGAGSLLKRRQLGTVLHSTSGRYLAWATRDGEWKAFDLRTRRLALLAAGVDVSSVTWGACDAEVLLVLASGTLQRIDVAVIFDQAGSLSTRIGWRPSHRWRWMIPLLQEGIGAPVSYLAGLRDNLSRSPDVRPTDERTSVEDALHLLNLLRAHGDQQVEEFARAFHKASRDRERNDLELLSVDDVIRLVRDRFGGDAVILDCVTRSDRQLHGIVSRMSSANGGDVASKLRRSFLLATRAREFDIRVVLQRYFSFENFVLRSRAEQWQSELWWSDAIESFAIEDSSKDSSRECIPGRCEALEFVSELLAVLAKKDGRALGLGDDAILRASGFARIEIPFSGPSAASPAEIEAASFAPRCVRLKWMSQSEFVALSPSTNRLWTGRVGPLANARGGRIARFRGLGTGPQVQGGACSVGKRDGVSVSETQSPRPGESVELERPRRGSGSEPERVRIVGNRIEVVGPNGKEAAFSHRRSLKGYFANPHDPALIAVIDDSFDLIVLRLHG
jgi:hypothetical protein